MEVVQITERSRLSDEEKARFHKNQLIVNATRLSNPTKRSLYTAVRRLERRIQAAKWEEMLKAQAELLEEGQLEMDLAQ